MKITKEQFEAYVKVQKSGKYNMLTQAYTAMLEAGLDEETYFEIIRDYTYYNMQFGN